MRADSMQRHGFLANYLLYIVISQINNTSGSRIFMSQVKIYALQQTIEQFRNQLSHAIHQALVDSLNYPVEKKFQRFISLATSDFIYPHDRSENYLIIEISMFEGRSNEAKKRLIRLLFTYIQQHCGISPHDVEITIFETPKVNWGIRGQHADELKLNYQVNV